MRINRRTALSQLAVGSVLTGLLGRAAFAETTSYEYDALGRLVKATFNGGQVVQYTYDAAGNRTQVARVNGAPSISSFSASPTSITSGSSSTLSWSTTNTTNVSINNGVGTVAASGSTTVSPTSTTTYTLTANGPGGAADTEQATVTVTSPSFNQTIQVTGSGPVNLRTLANSNGYNGAQNATVTFEVSSGVTITGDSGSPESAGGIGIDSGTWPTGSYSIALTLTVKSGGIVRGGGGGGGSGAPDEYSYGTSGGSGGDAIYCRLPMTVNINSGGEAKGGGQGGTGGSVSDPNPFDENPASGAGGGGGGGAPNGSGGSGANYGSSGTTSGGGAGGAGYGDGSSGSAGAGYAQYGANGGYCVRKNGHSVTVNNSGTTAGTIG